MSGALQRDPLWAALKLAEHFDPTIRIAPDYRQRLLRRYVAPLAYCR